MQLVHVVWPVSAACMPAVQLEQVNIVSKSECDPLLHGVHDFGHVVEEMLNFDVFTRLGEEDPALPVAHPFKTSAESLQWRVLAFVNVLSGQVSSSLAPSIT